MSSGMLRAAAAAILFALACVPSAAHGAQQPKDIGHLWKIARAGVPDSYVFGTIHIADPRVSTPAPVVRDALARSQTLAVEMVPEAADPAAAEMEMLEPGVGLPSLLSPDLYARVEAALTERGIAPATIPRLKPWAAMMKLAPKGQAAGAEPNLDAQLLDAARKARMRIVPLELLEEQISAFDAIPLASQIALLQHATDHREALAATVEPTIDAWRRGHFRALEAIVGAAFDPFPGMGEHRANLLHNIIDNRTVLMHHRLREPLRTGRVFIAIGAMHLAGRHGLLEMLRADGFAVRPVW